jgi:tetratricopeptide (TPR) repeat protein
MSALAEIVKQYQTQISDIKERLKSAEFKDRASQLEQEIRELYKDIAVAIKHLMSLQDSIKGLISEYKSVNVSDDQSKVMIRSFVETMRTDSLGSSTYVAEGWNQICTGEFEKAIVSLTNAVKLNPTDTKAMGLLGWAFSYQGRYDEALEVCLKVLQMEPNNDAVRNNLGFVCLKKQIYGEAIEHFSRVLKSGKDRTAVLYAHYYMGLVYLERQMLDDAIFFFSKATVLGPNLIEAYYHLGQAYYFKKMPGAAIREWEKCVKLSPHNWWAQEAQKQIEIIKSEEG